MYSYFGDATRGQKFPVHKGFADRTNRLAKNGRCRDQFNGEKIFASSLGHIGRPCFRRRRLSSMAASEKKALTLGHSPDPDDAFMFYALAKNLIPTGGWTFHHLLQDIQTLNERATRGELDISAISFHAYPFVRHHYALLPCGASMGDGYGPCVVGREVFTAAE